MARASRPHYEGEPTLAQVMRQPKWIAALALAILVAGLFAWLGRWQMGHAITLEQDKPGSTETVRPISEVTEPGRSVTDRAAGMVLSTEGRLVPGDFLVVEERVNGDRVGAWVVGHLATEASETSSGQNGHLVVAIGWAPTAEDAERAIDAIEADPALVSAAMHLEGRYMPSDAAVVPKPSEDPTRLTTLAPAQIVNLWAPFDGLPYAGFLVVHPVAPFEAATLAELGLEPIDSVPPLPVETVNWLNLFYAAEWVVFAGFAIYFWFRLVRDDWEKQHELKLLAEAEAEAEAPV